MDRPYHAVKDVRIFTTFPGIDVESLVLIDLPGAKEAGLDIDRQFLQDLRYDLDLLIQVKRPTTTESFWTSNDQYVLELSDRALGAVDLKDHHFVFVNEDSTHVAPDSLQNTLREIHRHVDDRGVRVLQCDLNPAADRPDIVHSSVHERLLTPILEHLAGNLGRMDATHILDAFQTAADVAAAVGDSAAELSRRASTWQSVMPNEEALLRDRAKRLRNEVGKSLAAILGDYKKRVDQGLREPTLDRRINDAVRTGRAWVNDGLGQGDWDTWQRLVVPYLLVDQGECVDDQYTLLRRQMTTIFASVDGATAEAAGELRTTIASALRDHLGETLVPDSERPLEALLETMRLNRSTQGAAARTNALVTATEDLMALEASYGHVFLRIGRPIVREIVPPDAWRAIGAAATDRRGSPGYFGETDQRRAAYPQGGSMNGGSDDGELAYAERVAIDLRNALTAAGNDAIRRLEQGIQAEAQDIVKVLAATTDQFWDDVSRAPDVEREFEDLCRPIRRKLWPQDFDGTNTKTAEELASVATFASDVATAAREILTMVRPDIRPDV